MLQPLTDLDLSGNKLAQYTTEILSVLSYNNNLKILKMRNTGYGNQTVAKKYHRLNYSIEKLVFSDFSLDRNFKKFDFPENDIIIRDTDLSNHFLINGKYDSIQNEEAVLSYALHWKERVKKIFFSFLD